LTTYKKGEKMSNENQAPVEQSDATSGVSDKVNDAVSYESYKKALNEKKNYQAKLSEYEQEVQRLREEKMSAEGKKDELLSTYQKKVQDLSEKLDKTTKHYAWNTVKKEIEKVAIDYGCINTDDFINLINDDDLRSIEVGENFSVDKRSIIELVENNKSKRHYLFKSGSKSIANGIPNTKPIDESKEDLSKLSLEELKNKVKELHYKNKR
jgi:hypothetical protein